MGGQGGTTKNTGTEVPVFSAHLRAVGCIYRFSIVVASLSVVLTSSPLSAPGAFVVVVALGLDGDLTDDLQSAVRIEDDSFT